MSIKNENREEREREREREDRRWSSCALSQHFTFPSPSSLQ